MSNFGFTLALIPALLLAAVPTWGADASSGADTNQTLSFKRIVIEPPVDNVGGAFKDTTERAYREVFRRNPRFEVVTDKANSDAFIQTRIEKTTSGTQLEIVLGLSATGEIFSKEHMTVQPKAIDVEVNEALRGLLKTTLRRIPFYGTVTGRDGSELTFDIGELHGLRRGDIIQISRIDNVKRHPLLKSIVDVTLVPVGSAAIDQAEDMMSFGHVNSEFPGEKIQRWHKVTAIEGQLVEPNVAKNVDDSALGADDDRPKLGFFTVGGFIGSFSGSASTPLPAPRTFSGNAFSPGVDLGGELWLTKNWFADMSYGFMTMSYSQVDTAAATVPEPAGARCAASTFDIHGGFRYLLHQTVYGPQAFIKLGYRTFNWNRGTDPAQLVSEVTYSGLDLGVGGILPIGAENRAGLQIKARVLLFPGFTESVPRRLGDNVSASGVGAFFGGYYQFNPRLSVRAGLDFDVYQASTQDGSSTTNQTRTGFAPSLVYYF